MIKHFKHQITLQLTNFIPKRPKLIASKSQDCQIVDKEYGYLKLVSVLGNKQKLVVLKEMMESYWTSVLDNIREKLTLLHTLVDQSLHQRLVCIFSALKVCECVNFPREFRNKVALWIKMAFTQHVDCL